MSADELDLDAELLGLAGDGDDSDSESEADAPGDTAEQTQQVEDRTPSEEPKPSVEKAPLEEPPNARRGVAQKVKKSRGKKKVSRKEIEDDLDNLADSPSPAPSLGSDAMSESGPASPTSVAASPPDDGPLFPVDGKFYSAADRAEILAMPEIQREEKLAERAQEALRKEQDLQLKRALAATQAAASKHKRKAATADLEDGGLRKRAAKTGASALDNYKKAREAKGADRTSRLDVKSTQRGRSSRSPSSANGSDRDADGESEVEWADTTNSALRKDEPPADLKDFDHCKVGRSAFAHTLFFPNFEETMKGCFCRISIGMNRETGQNMYRMTQIRGFTHGKPFPLEVQSGGRMKTIQCDLYATVAHGSHERPWPLHACSDGNFTLAELQRYKETMDKERVRVPRKGWLIQKLEDLHRLREVNWTEEALAGKFRRQREMEKRVDPATAAKAKKDGILKRKVEAEDTGDAEEVARCEAELAALENSAATNGGGRTGVPVTVKGSPAKPAAAQTHQERMALLNLKNRRNNADDVRKALLEERKKHKEAREKAVAEKKAKKLEAAAGLLGVPNSSNREDMREMFGDLSDLSRAGTPMSGVSTPKLRRSRQGTPMNGVKEVGKSKLGLGAGKKKGGQDELDGLDLGIDIEI